MTPLMLRGRRRPAATAPALPALALALALGATAAHADLPSVDALVHFSASRPEGGTGAQPTLPVTEAADGYLYGRTPYGGGTVNDNNGGTGVVFYRLKPDGSQYEVLATGDHQTAPNNTRWISASDGYLYSAGDGTTAGGYLRRYAPGGNQGWVSFGADTDMSSSILETNGRFYIGSLTSIRSTALDGSDVTTLHTGTTALGSGPYYLFPGSDGKLYGVTRLQGVSSSNRGVVFSIGLDGSGYTLLQAFTSATTGSLQGVPSRPLVEGVDGKLYGVTSSGGTASGGTFYRIDRDGQNFEILHTFSSTTQKIGGYRPDFLLRGQDDHLYLVTRSGGLALDGTAANGAIVRYRIDSGALELLHAFAGVAGDAANATYTNASGATVASTVNLGSNATGFEPYGLTQLRDGRFVGVARLGGQSGWGTVFEFKPGDEVAQGSLINDGEPTLSFGIGSQREASTTLALGVTFRLSWSGTFISSCTATSSEPDTSWTGRQGTTSGANLALVPVTPRQIGTWTYTLTCAPQSNGREPVSASVTVEVVPQKTEVGNVGNGGSGALAAALFAPSALLLARRRRRDQSRRLVTSSR